MSRVIIYKAENGSVALVIPNPDCKLTIQQIADKDVPSGRPYKFVDESELPSDYTFFDAWEADLSDPDGKGADHGAGSLNAVIGWEADGTPILRKEAVCQ